LDDYLDSREAVEKVRAALPASYRKDYLKLCAGVRVSAHRKQEIYSLIKEILDG
jgi:hypothetical protein